MVINFSLLAQAAVETAKKIVEMPAVEKAQTGFAAAQTGFALSPTPPPTPTPDLGFTFTLIDTIQKGGLVMYPMILLSIFVFALIIERMLFLRGTYKNSGPFLLNFFEHWDKGDKTAAIKEAKGHEGPFARMIRKGIGRMEAGAGKDNIREALTEGALDELPVFNRFISTIAVIGTMMPILGLLGTVSGMISTFEVITVKGTGDPKALAGGISEALITTQTGLIFALPILLLHNYLEGRVDNLATKMESSISRFLGQIESTNGTNKE